MASKQDSFFVEETDFMAAVHALVDVDSAAEAYPIVEWVSDVVSGLAIMRKSTVTTPNCRSWKNTKSSRICLTRIWSK